MLAAGLILGWAAYGLGSWGYILIRGWNIPFTAWFSPLNPYQFPPGGPVPIPDTQLFPGGASAAAPAAEQQTPGTHVTPGAAKQGLGGDLPSVGINPGRR